jgi:hypothetical protein
MKKIIFILAIGLFTMSVNAQNFSVGLSGGLPSGDASDFYTFSLILDASARWEVADSFMAGLTTGYINAFGDSVTFGGVTADFEDAGFIPLAASGRYMISEQFSFGADVGYAIGVAPDGNDGGFYYAPKAIYQVSENIGIVAAYRGISRDSTSFDIISLGVEFSFN